MEKFRVFDDRTNKTIFESDDKWEAFMYLSDNYDESHRDFEHVWLEKVNKDDIK